LSGGQDAEQPRGQEIRSDRDAFAAGRDLTINKYYDRAGEYPAGAVLPLSEKAHMAGVRVPAGGHLVGRTASQWNPIALGVHRAIHVSAGEQGDLPAFVARSHDRVLRAEAASAVAGSKLVVLVGGSSTGKTRSAVEAVRSVLPDWPLLYPLTATELTALIAGGRVGEGTVLWLNESQVYLEGDGGADAAAALRGLLASGQPLLAIGTLWPEYWLACMRPPEFGAPDPYPQARQLLETAVKIDVPDCFTGTELAQAQDLAVSDQRLAIAIGTEHGHRVTQVLAGGPDLVDRWHNAPTPYCRAVITVAVDARRLGHLSALPTEMLRAAAAVYLDGPQRAAAPPGWFADALSYACRTVKGAIAPLTATSKAVGQVDGYLLADYLDQHGRTSRRHALVPDALWAALATHARTGADLNRLGTAAANRGRYQQATILWHAAGQGGDMSMALALRRLLARAGHHAEAEQTLWRAAEAGSQEALTRLTAMLRREERHQELEHVLRRAAEAGHHQAACDLAVLLTRTGRAGEAVRVVQQVVADGDRYAQSLLSILLERTIPPEYTEDTGQPDTRDSRTTGTPTSALPAAGIPDTGQDEMPSAPQRENAKADRVPLPGQRKVTPRPEIPRSRVPSGGRERWAAVVEAAAERERALRSSGAELSKRPDDDARARGSETPMAYWKRRQAGAEQSLRDLARAGDTDATRELAVFLTATDRSPEGEKLLRAAASAAGDVASLRLLAEVITRTGRIREATMLARYGLAEDGTTASAW
jgi:hypothetical protein